MEVRDTKDTAQTEDGASRQKLSLPTLLRKVPGTGLLEGLIRTVLPGLPATWAIFLVVMFAIFLLVGVVTTVLATKQQNPAWLIGWTGFAVLALAMFFVKTLTLHSDGAPMPAKSDPLEADGTLIQSFRVPQDFDPVGRDDLQSGLRRLVSAIKQSLVQQEVDVDAASFQANIFTPVVGPHTGAPATLRMAVGHQVSPGLDKLSFRPNQGQTGVAFSQREELWVRVVEWDGDRRVWRGRKNLDDERYQMELWQEKLLPKSLSWVISFPIIFPDPAHVRHVLGVINVDGHDLPVEDHHLENLLKDEAVVDSTSRISEVFARHQHAVVSVTLAPV